MKKIIELIKKLLGLGEKSVHAGNYAELKKEAIEEIYKIEPVAVEEEKPKKKAPAKKKPAKKPATKKKKDGSK